jgi:hypothetical protein
MLKVIHQIPLNLQQGSRHKTTYIPLKIVHLSIPGYLSNKLELFIRYLQFIQVVGG